MIGPDDADLPDDYAYDCGDDGDDARAVAYEEAQWKAAFEAHAAAKKRQRGGKLVVASSSCLAEWLMETYALGTISARMVQEVASCARRDGLLVDAVVELADLGASGAQPQNVSRDLIKAHTVFKFM